MSELFKLETKTVDKILEQLKKEKVMIQFKTIQFLRSYTKNTKEFPQKFPIQHNGITVLYNLHVSVDGKISHKVDSFETEKLKLDFNGISYKGSYSLQEKTEILKDTLKSLGGMND